MPKRKKNKGVDYEYVGTARRTTSPDTEYASEVAPSPGKRDETRAKPKGRC